MIDTRLLRQKILDLAIRGKLVPQDPADEPVSELLKKIKAEKEALIKAGKMKRDKHESFIFRGDDKRYYEQVDGKTTDITKEIPFDLPDGWAWCRVKEIGNILYGVSESAQRNGRYKLLRITDIQNDHVNWESVPYTNFTEDASAYFLQNGDIVFARTGATVGKSFLIESAPENAIYASYLIRVRFIFSSIAKFVKLFFGSSDYWNQVIAKSVGTGQPNVNGTSLSELLLPLPPLAEQKRIVAQIEGLLKCVDEVDRESETLEKSIALAKQKILDLAIQGKLVPQDPNDEPATELLKKIKAEKEALIKAGKMKRDKHESFIFRGDDNCYHENINGKITDPADEIPFDLPQGWVWTRLYNIAKLADGDWIESKDQAPEGIRLIQTGNIGECRFLPHDERARFISLETFSRLNCTEIFPGDCLISRLPEPLGRACIVPFINERMITAVDCTITRPYASVLSAVYFMYFTASTTYIEYVKKNATGSTRKRISRANLDQTVIPLPPLAEQKRIVSQVEKLFAVLETMRG